MLQKSKELHHVSFGKKVLLVIGTGMFLLARNSLNPHKHICVERQAGYKMKNPCNRLRFHAREIYFPLLRDVIL